MIDPNAMTSSEMLNVDVDELSADECNELLRDCEVATEEWLDLASRLYKRIENLEA